MNHAAKIWEETVLLPTYPAAEPEKYPLFIEKRAYQGSTGKVYPLPVTETVSDVCREVAYHAVWLENEYLRDCVAQSGALITEFPPGFPSSARTFPIRNRIISGLCDATIVIEAGVKSGSLITANCAIEQGRDVFAPPGDVFNSSYAGANRLIRDGARPLLSIYDLITEYSVRYPDKIKPENMAKALEYLSGKRELTQEQAKEEPKTVELPHESVKKFEPEPRPEEFRVKKLVSIPVGLSEKARKIYESMGEEPLFADEIAAKTGFAPWEVVSSMTELELEDLVCLCAGKRYKKI